MLESGADRSLVPAQFCSELQTEPFATRVRALRDSIAILLYPLCLTLIMIATIGMFFGAGFFLLVHHAEGIALNLDAREYHSDFKASGDRRFVSGGLLYNHNSTAAADAEGHLADGRGQTVAAKSVETPELLTSTVGVGIGEGDELAVAFGAQETFRLEQFSSAIFTSGLDQYDVNGGGRTLSVELGKLARELPPPRRHETRTRRSHVSGLAPSASGRNSSPARARSSAAVARPAR
jgi:hypothetical protein